MMGQIKYYNEHKTDVTKRIKERKTFVFEGSDARAQAIKKANQLRSYIYDLFVMNNKKNLEFVGYAVPK